MKQSILFMTILVSVLFSSCDQSKKSPVSVSLFADYTNVLYFGVNNPITLNLNGVSSDDIKLNVTGIEGAKIEGSGNKYFVTLANLIPDDQFCNIDVFYKKSNLKITSIPFKVRRIPNPQLSLGGKDRGKITPDEIKDLTEINMTNWGLNFDPKCKIVSYVFAYVSPSGEASPPIIVEGGSFNSTILSYVQKASIGSKFYFYDIKGSCPGDAAARKLNNIELEVR
jgi:hypothetical protein